MAPSTGRDELHRETEVSRPGGSNMTATKRSRPPRTRSLCPPSGAVLPGSKSAGQSLVEFALIMPLIFLLILNAVNFGGFFFAWITIASAARSGAQYMTMSSASVGAPTAPTDAQITTQVTNDISSLQNVPSLKVRVCRTNINNIPAPTCTGPGSQTPPQDPEKANYILGSVDVTYTYVPYLSAWSFMGIQLTPFTGIIHQRAVMRMQQ